MANSMGPMRLKGFLIFILLLTCGNLLHSPIKIGAKSRRSRESDDFSGDLRDLHQEALNKKSSLRFDWTNLPPSTPLGKAIERSQSQCLNASAAKAHGPQQIVHVRLIPYGMGSSLHIWMDPLYWAFKNNKVLITGDGKWPWNDQDSCSHQFELQKSAKAIDWPAHNSSMPGAVPEYSALWCYFGWHESALRCPPGTLAWNASVEDHGEEQYWYKYQNKLSLEENMEMHTSVAEWLFQNVSRLVIEEAERQIREEAFPLTNNGTGSRGKTSRGTFQRWIGMPDANSLITVHIRWGDKGGEMALVSIEEVVKAVDSLLTPDELSGDRLVHIYVATEDPAALEMFNKVAVSRKWQVHSSGPTNPVNGTYHMVDAARHSNGRAGLASLAALLIALEANRYVLARGSNWSRLIDELRKSVVDSRCGNCTKMVDLREDEW